MSPQSNCSVEQKKDDENSKPVIEVKKIDIDALEK